MHQFIKFISIKKLYLIVMMLLTVSCVTSKIKSSKAANFEEKISRLFITLKGADNNKPFFDSFNYEFTKALREKSVNTNTYYYTPLSLSLVEEDFLNNQISSFGPKLIMTINQTESRQRTDSYSIGRQSRNTGGTFDVKLFQPDSKNPVWRANLKVNAEFGIKTSAKKAAEILIKELIENGLL